MRTNPLAALTISLTLLAASSADAQLTSPKIGWTAELSTVAHNVSGSVTILDEDTVQVDDFTYDGGGIVVYFYLGQEDTHSAYVNGLAIGEDLFGNSFDGSQPAFTVDLPNGETLEGWHAISVWCVTANANFGSGTFTAPSLPGDFNGDGRVDAGDYTVWRDHLGAPDESAVHNNGDGQSGVDTQDYPVWTANFGNGGTGAGSLSGENSFTSMSAVPEPAACVLVGMAIVVALAGRRRLR